MNTTHPRFATYEEYEQAWYDDGGIDCHEFPNIHLKDCPKCKYGTLDKTKQNKWKCADCGYEIPAA